MLTETNITHPTPGNRVAMGQPLVVKKRRRRRRGGEEEEPVLRTTCDNCTNAKVKCNGESPCVRCRNKNIQCEYTFKKRCGPKRRKGVDGNRGLGDSEGLLAQYATEKPALGFDDHLEGMATALNKDEVECVGVFMQTLNSFLPMTSFATVKLAATPMEGTSAESVTDDENEELNQLHHARKALLHGVIAVGAEFLDKEDTSATHAGIARQEIKECFDAAVPELVGAYLILALYWTHQKDGSKIARYIGLAQQSSAIICEPPPELVAAVTFITVVLYDAKVLSNMGCRIDPPGQPLDPSMDEPIASQERVLKILSYVLLSIHERSVQSEDPSFGTNKWDADALAAHVDEAKGLLDKVALNGTPTPNDMSRCVVVVLQAYFLALKDDRRRAIVITEQLADLVGDNPLVLHLPIVWSMVWCMRALLESANRSIAVERLQSVMEPLETHLGFSSEESMVEQELMCVFLKKQRPQPVRGRASSGSGAATRAPLSRESLLMRQKAQTSSLNVGAAEYPSRGRASIDLLAIEPSAAPRRRALPASTSRQGTVSGGGNRGEDGTLSPSLISAAMASSAASVLASSPPASRAGALSRAPTARGSLSNSNPFERAPASMLNLDETYMSEYPESTPGVVPVSRPADMALPGISRHVRPPKDEPQGPEGMSSGGGQNGDGAEGEAVLDETKLDADRRELMRRQQVHPSFRADAPVSLEQVESNMARLGVSTPGEGDAALNSLVTSMDLDAAAELIATKTSFIS